MKKSLLMTLITMLVVLTLDMKAMAAEKQAYYVVNGGTMTIEKLKKNLLNLCNLWYWRTYES